MADIESLLNRWQSAGVLDGQSANRIRAWEAGQKRPSGLRWQGMVALILGALLLASGVALFVSAHWDELGPIARLIVVVAMVTVFHVAAATVRDTYRGVSTALHAAGTASVGAAIALVGQIFNIAEHWPSAIMLWALAALAGWVLLHDQVQETLTLLLLPAWIFCELMYATERSIGQDVYLGRFLFVWSLLYLTVFLGSQRKAVQGILFAVSAIEAVAGTALMLESWRSWHDWTPVSLHVRVWGWIAIAIIPVCFSLVRFSKSTLPVIAAVAFSIVLPWCNRSWLIHYGKNNAYSYTRSEPTVAAHLLVAAFAVFVMWWGVRKTSKALVNFGIVGFAIAIAWFYFSNIFDKMGRSLGLIGIGILFLAGGWALEKTRRSLIARMATYESARPAEAQ